MIEHKEALCDCNIPSVKTEGKFLQTRSIIWHIILGYKETLFTKYKFTRNAYAFIRCIVTVKEIK